MNIFYPTISINFVFPREGLRKSYLGVFFLPLLVYDQQETKKDMKPKNFTYSIEQISPAAIDLEEGLKPAWVFKIFLRTPKYIFFGPVVEKEVWRETTISYPPTKFEDVEAKVKGIIQDLTSNRRKLRIEVKERSRELDANGKYNLSASFEIYYYHYSPRRRKVLRKVIERWCCTEWTTPVGNPCFIPPRALSEINELLHLNPNKFQLP